MFESWDPGSNASSVGVGTVSMSALPSGICCLYFIINPICIRLSLICLLIFPGRNSKIFIFIWQLPSKRSFSSGRTVSSDIHTVGVLLDLFAGISTAFLRFRFFISKSACLSCWEQCYSCLRIVRIGWKGCSDLTALLHLGMRHSVACSFRNPFSHLAHFQMTRVSLLLPNMFVERSKYKEQYIPVLVHADFAFEARRL